MKAGFLYLFLSLYTIPTSATNAAQDSTRLQVFYDATYKDRVEYPVDDDYQVLEIGEHSSFFYSVQEERYYEFRDSIGRLDNGEDFMTNLMNSSDNMPSEGASYRVYKNYPEAGRLTFVDRIFSWFYKYEEPLPEFNWQMEEGDTIIATYPCHKATTEYHGRKWTAWYCLDLPYDDGPWKLRGLPGLILQARESEGIFSFTCKSISKTTARKPIELEKMDYEKCTGKDFQEAITAYWLNQTGFVLRKDGHPEFVTGPELPEYVFTACLLEYYP